MSQGISKKAEEMITLILQFLFKSSIGLWSPGVQNVLLEKELPIPVYHSLNVVWQECTNVLFLNRFCIPGGSYPQSCAQGCYSTDSSEYKGNWGWQLVWQTINSNEQWQSSVFVIFYVTCLQSFCRNKKKGSQCTACPNLSWNLWS